MTDSHIIIAGQSNALGYLNEGPAPYVPTARVQIWTDTNGDGVADAWNYMRPGVNTGTPANPLAHGPEVQIANDWLRDHPTGYLWIVKDAQTVKGSTGLAADPTQTDWSPHSSGEMYDAATGAVNAAMHNLDGTQFHFSSYDAVMWMQGEQDAYDPAKAAAYGANLTEFIADARTDWHVTDFILGRITDTAGAAADNLAVRDAQYTVDYLDPKVASFKTIGFEMQPDNLHYDATGQVSLGDAFYTNWMGL